MPTPDRSSLLEKVRRLPHRPGVYLLRDRFGTILYVGKAKDLKKRVSTYFQPSRKFRVEQPKIAAMIDLVFDLDTVELRSDTEALLLEGKLIKQYKPRYNTDFTDDKRFLLVRLDPAEELPRFRLTRQRKEDAARYWGPFAHSGLLRRTLAEMRRRFGILLGDARPVRLADGRWRLYDDARREIYGPAGGDVTREEYATRLAEAMTFLEGEVQAALERLREDMMKAADARQFERAAELRDLIQALETTVAPARRDVRPSLLGHGLPTREALAELGRELGLRGPPEVLECFDISHISGTYCVASMVRFVGGKPDRAGYRRFQIRTFVGNDDFRAMAEVVGRRYTRLREEGRPFPDLVVIDGGRGQVNAALRAFAEHQLAPPPVIGLAKQEELVIFGDDRLPLRLPGHHPGRRLLQHLRDEAHRLANAYNADLRSRKVRESILFDCPGLGDRRRTDLLNHFGSLERLRAASAADIAAVPGFGTKMAADIHAFLHRAPPPAPAIIETVPRPPELPGDGHLPGS